MNDNATKLLIEIKQLIDFFGSVDNAYQKVLHCKAPCHFKQGKKKILQILRRLKVMNDAKICMCS